MLIKGEEIEIRVRVFFIRGFFYIIKVWGLNDLHEETHTCAYEGGETLLVGFEPEPTSS